MKAVIFRKLESKVLEDEEGRRVAEWAISLKPCRNSRAFLGEAIWVILCSGISYNAAKTMEEAFYRTGTCNHPHKATAISKWQANHRLWWKKFSAMDTVETKISFLRTLPYMKGKALPFQLAKNLGINSVCKPDVHLIRLADLHGYKTPQAMCERIARKTHKTVAYIDTVLWFAAMKGWAYKEPDQEGL